MNDPTEAAPECVPKYRTIAESFAILARDSRISHGAFHLYHVIYDYRGRGTGRCWPSQPTLQRDLHCSNDSIRPWTDELVSAGWLAVEVKGRRYVPGEKLMGCRFIYTLLDGDGQPLLKSGKVTFPKSRKAFNLSQKQERSFPKSRKEPFLKVGVEVSTPIKGALHSAPFEKEGEASGLPHDGDGSIAARSEAAASPAPQESEYDPKTAIKSEL
jgi:hypothetical protein